MQKQILGAVPHAHKTKLELGFGTKSRRAKLPNGVLQQMPLFGRMHYMHSTCFDSKLVKCYKLFVIF